MYVFEDQLLTKTPLETPLPCQTPREHQSSVLRLDNSVYEMILLTSLLEIMKHSQRVGTPVGDIKRSYKHTYIL